MRRLRPATIRLRAEVDGDYQVIAACLQDALMPLAEMTFMARESRFVAVFDRFMWEHCAPAGPTGRPPFIVLSALRVEGVRAARLRGIDQADRRARLELLTLTRDEGGALCLMFAGGGIIRLEGERLVCLIEDLAEPRPVRRGPEHRPEVADESSEERS
jgi:hypothetical protein